VREDFAAGVDGDEVSTIDLTAQEGVAAGVIPISRPYKFTIYKMEVVSTSTR
jgi:hypothetical protein